MSRETEPRARLLFAEDDEGFREAMAGMFRQEGYDCTCVGTLEDAVAAARESDFQLLLMDIRMPGNEGLHLVREVLRTSSSISVIVITGYPSLKTAVEGIDLSVGAYLSKPVTFEELLEKVELVLRERKRDLQREERLGHLEEGFRELALQLERLGKHTGLLDTDAGISDVPELRTLSPREWDVLLEVLRGYRVTAIGRKLAISSNTVRNHLRAIFRKLGVRSQSELLLKLRPIPSTSEQPDPNA